MPTVKVNPTDDNEQLKQKIKELKSMVITAAKATYPLLDGLTAQQKQRIQNTLADWGAASDADRIFTNAVLSSLGVIGAAITLLDLD